MRRYDDPVEVRRGMVAGPGGRQEGPEQFLWKGRLWKVCAVEAHWVETGAWWQSGGVRAVVGNEVGDTSDTRNTGGAGRSGSTGSTGSSGVDLAARDLAAEREVWRVEAARGLASAAGSGRGVFDLTFDWASGSWLLTRCVD